MTHLFPGNHVPTYCPNGRKISWSFENPIDNIIVMLGEPIQPILYKLGIVPNMITGLGVIIRLITLHYLSIGNKELFLIGSIFTYFLDCLDGNYARRYNMCTVIGDYFDHFSDLFFHGIILYFLFFKTRLRESSNFFYWFIIVFLLAVLLCWHLGHQENHYPSGEQESYTLSFLKFFSSIDNKHHIQISRFFGCGTFAILIYTLLYFYM